MDIGIGIKDAEVFVAKGTGVAWSKIETNGTSEHMESSQFRNEYFVVDLTHYCLHPDVFLFRTSNYSKSSSGKRDADSPFVKLLRSGRPVVASQGPG